MMLRYWSSFCFLAVALSCASASTVTLTDPAAMFTATAPGPCFPASVSACGAQAYLTYGSTIDQNTTFASIASFHPVPGEPAPTGTELFLSGFNAFGGGWILTNGGDLALDIDISTFRARATNFVAGVEIQVDVTPQAGYSGPALANLFWIQSLLINYRPADPGNAMHHHLDEAGYNDIGLCTVLAGSLAAGGAGTYCGPVYPYQYSDKHFYDQPTGIYPIDSMRGIALLASVDADARVVTVFNGGVSYGYDVVAAAIPEPATWWLAGCGAGLILLLRRGSGTRSRQ